jgi:hypothetical protein
MFWRHEIQIPSGFEAVVDGRIEGRRPLRVGAYDQVHFVSFAPLFEEVSAEAVSKEGIAHSISVTVKVECRRDNLSEMLRDWGYSTYRNIVRVSAEEVAKRQNLIDSIEAAIRTYAQSRGLFELSRLEEVRQELHQKISVECARARVAGEVVSCDVAPAIPEPDLLARLAARAGLKEVTDKDLRVREYEDAALGAIVEFFLETIRQREMIQAEAERSRADAERSRVEAQKQIAIARAEVKIVEIDQENRIAARQSELQSEEARRQQSAQERNAGIKESGAAYEFAYKSRRLEEERSLADRELEIARVRDQEEAALRERRRMDARLELERERELAQIRADEKAAALNLLGSLVEKLGQIPATDYRGVRTLVTSTGGTEAKDFATGLVLGLLSRASEDQSLLREGNVEGKGE